MIELNINWLKSHCQMIHYFGLGFIQLKLNKENRLHFYTQHLPLIISEEEVHNHRYDFTSKILKGTLTQEIYNVIPGNKYIKEYESCKENVSTNKSVVSCDLFLNSKHTYTNGSEYFISHETFHKVKATECITFLTRSNYKKENAEVIRLNNSIKVCPFSMKIEEKNLWSIIEKMI